MCSWCWGFKPVWTSLKSQLDDRIKVRNILGGLAPDNEEIMPLAMQQKLQNTWKTIQQTIPGTQFNFDFWTQCEPRRSTYLACRAVIAARTMRAASEEEMIFSIQQAYYLNAQNPSEEETLIDCAKSVGLGDRAFVQHLHANETQKLLVDDILFSESIGATGYPGLIFETPNGYHAISIDYNNASIMQTQIKNLMKS